MKRGRLKVHRKAYKKKAHLRRAYRRDHTFVGATKVSASRVPSATFTIKDIGAKGRGKKLIKVRKGLLKKFGYATHLPEAQRHVALRKADRKYGSVSLFKKLHAQVVLRKRTQPDVARVFRADRDWVKRNLLSRSEALQMTSKPRHRWMAMSPEARALAMPERK
jgi:hypothetical protein